MDNLVKIVIPAKGNSTRIPDKNYKDFYNEQSLLEICIKKAKTLGIPVAVSSEDPRILALAERLGVEAQERPADLAEPETTPQELAKHIAEANKDFEYIYYIHCTNPLIDVKHFEIPLQLLSGNAMKNFDSINSAYKLQKHLWEYPLGVSVSKERRALYNTEARPNTQEILNLVCLEYSLNLVKTETLLETGDFIGKNPAFMYIPYHEVIDIDEPIDFEIAQELYKKRKIKSV